MTRADRPQLTDYRVAEPTATCGHEDHGEPVPATTHLWLHDGGEDATLLACAGHVPTARLAGQLVAEHPVGPLCEMPGTGWGRKVNVCVMIEADG